MTRFPLPFPLLLRTLLLWLTLLAFPGLAAAAAQPCALHAHAGGSAEASASVATHAAAAEPTMTMAGHAVLDDRLAPAPAPDACREGAHGHDRGHGAHDHGRCSACPACCAGVAPAPALMLGVAGPGPAFVAVPFHPGHLPSVDPFLIERPPRPDFA